VHLLFIMHMPCLSCILPPLIDILIGSYLVFLVLLFWDWCFMELVDRTKWLNVFIMVADVTEVLCELELTIKKVKVSTTPDGKVMDLFFITDTRFTFYICFPLILRSFLLKLLDLFVKTAVCKLLWPFWMKLTYMVWRWKRN